MNASAAQQVSRRKSKSVLWCLPLDCFPPLRSKPGSRHKQSRTGNHTAVAVGVAQHAEDAREGNACDDPLMVSQSRSVIEDPPQISNEPSPALPDVELSAVGESIHGFVAQVEKNEVAYEKLIEEIRELNALVGVHREELNPNVQDVQLSVTGKAMPYIAELKAPSNCGEQFAPEEVALPLENSEGARGRAVVNRLVLGVLERQQQVQVSVANEDFGDNTVLRADTRNSSECELAQALSLRRSEGSVENVASERREVVVVVPSRRTQDRTEWAKVRSLRRSGTAYENEPAESRADANLASERREDVVPSRSIQDRTEWAKMRSLRRAEHAYENEPAESSADENVASEHREDVAPIRSIQDRTEWAKTRSLRRAEHAYENEPVKSRADVCAERQMNAFAMFGA